MNSRRLRVVIVSSSYWPHEGGAERQLREVFSSDEVARELDVRVLTEPVPGMPHRQVVDGLMVVRTPDPVPRLPRPNISFGFNSLTQLARWKPDMVISSQLGAATLAAGIHARRTGIPHIVRIAGPRISDVGDGSYSEDLLHLGSRHGAALRWLLGNRRCRVVAPAKHMVASALAQFPELADRISYIPNGVTLKVEDISPTSKCDVIWHGRDDWFKNPEAFVSLVKSRPGYSFVALGRSELPALPNLTDAGWVDDPALFVAGARVALMTSRYEGSPNFALQALTLGVPVAGFRIAALEEFAEQYPDSIFLAERRDIESLGNAVDAACARGPSGRQPVVTLGESRTWWLSLVRSMTSRAAQEASMTSEMGQSVSHQDVERWDGNKRFRFGENWLRFLETVDVTRVAGSRTAIAAMLDTDSLEGLRVLDLGSGSGLSSLAMREMGADVVSVDFDPQAVECTREIRNRFGHGEDGKWVVSEGSALDQEFLQSLGAFDLVYSWGVLHHTGAMWEGISNAAGRVAPNGRLFISIYNDQGLPSKMWTKVKRKYVESGEAKRRVITEVAGCYLTAQRRVGELVIRALGGSVQRSTPARGMDRRRDLVDWVGGYPFEVAKPEQVFDFVKARGFELERLKTCGGRLGCNEFVFIRKA